MAAKLGSDDISFRLGAGEVAAVYLGSQEVWSAVPPIAASLLLNFNGEDESTTFTDSSANELSVTAYGGAEISTAESKFGGASGSFPGNGYAETAASSATELGTSDFTIEFWVWVRSLTGATFWMRTDTGQGQEGMMIGTDPILDEGLLVSSAGDNWDINAGDVFGPAMQEETWHHIAVTREGDTWRAFVDGIEVWSDTYAGAIYQPAEGALRIGSANTTDLYTDGYIDDLRIIKGTALYTANFTPPAAQLSANA
jgi:hypothetical protein